MAKKYIRKIDLMHRQFGVAEGRSCKDCSNFYRRRWNDKTFRKCEVYGGSYSEATDWNASYPACGMFNQTWDGDEIVRLVCPKKEEDKPLDGQMEIFLEESE